MSVRRRGKRREEGLALKVFGSQKAELRKKVDQWGSHKRRLKSS